MFYSAIHYYVLMLYYEKQGRVQVLFGGSTTNPPILCKTLLNLRKPNPNNTRYLFTCIINVFVTYIPIPSSL